MLVKLTENTTLNIPEDRNKLLITQTLEDPEKVRDLIVGGIRFILRSNFKFSGDECIQKADALIDEIGKRAPEALLVLSYNAASIEWPWDAPQPVESFDYSYLNDKIEGQTIKEFTTSFFNKNGEDA